MPPGDPDTLDHVPNAVPRGVLPPSPFPVSVPASNLDDKGDAISLTDRKTFFRPSLFEIPALLLDPALLRRSQTASPDCSRCETPVFPKRTSASIRKPFPFKWFRHDLSAHRSAPLGISERTSPRTEPPRRDQARIGHHASTCERRLGGTLRAFLCRTRIPSPNLIRPFSRNERSAIVITC